MAYVQLLRIHIVFRLDYELDLPTRVQCQANCDQILQKGRVVSALICANKVSHPVLTKAPAMCTTWVLCNAHDSCCVSRKGGREEVGGSIPFLLTRPWYFFHLFFFAFFPRKSAYFSFHKFLLRPIFFYAFTIIHKINILKSKHLKALSHVLQQIQRVSKPSKLAIPNYIPWLTNTDSLNSSGPNVALTYILVNARYTWL